MSCYRTWETSSGKTIDLHDMETRHILNSLKIVKEVSKREILYPMFQGEMAEYYADLGYEREQGIIEEAMLWVDYFKNELKDRGITEESIVL